MSDVAIIAEDVGKLYSFGDTQQQFPTLRDALVSRVSKLGNAFWNNGRSVPATRKKTFWAIRNVSFEIGRGEVVGILGSNGAGKSTVLKILSRVTDPTEGRVLIRGRIGSLLEVGTGFHPELSGRENTYLNGAILGMSRLEIQRRFDEIVGFADIGPFIDTPVKHYSSGMYLRLAFAIAAHLQSEIMIVDEVLAVGDIAFQKKCLGKIHQLAREGRTVLLVSHNMAAVQALCSRAILLENGRVTMSGWAHDVISAYTAEQAVRLNQYWKRPSDAPAAALSIEQVRVDLEGAQPRHALTIEIFLRSHAPHRAAFLAVDIRELGGTPIMQAIPNSEPFIADSTTEHGCTVTINIDGLIPGKYTAGIWVGSHHAETLDEVDDAVMFEVVDSPVAGRTYPHTPDHGYIVPESTVRLR